MSLGRTPGERTLGREVETLEWLQEKTIDPFPFLLVNPQKAFMNPVTSKTRAIFLILLSGIFYGGFSFFGVKILSAPLSINSMLFWRFLIATASMIFVCMVSKPPLPKTMTPWVVDFLLGAVLYGGGSAIYFMATETIGTGLAMVIFFSYPAMVILFSRVIDGTPITRNSFISLGLVFLGFILMSGQNEIYFSWRGAFLSGLGAFLYAAYVYISKRQLEAAHPLISTLTQCLGGCILFYLLAQGEGGLQIPVQTSTWIYCILIGLLCTSIPIVLLLKGLKTIDAGKAALLTVLEPLITLLLGTAFLNERLDSLQIVGMALILVGAVSAQFAAKS